MAFTGIYVFLNKQKIEQGDSCIVPIRYEDRFDIMKWRNEQLFHLRQEKPLTAEDQEHYFSSVIKSLFDQRHPKQILFSYLENNICIGYGGLVHINWKDRHAEISFLVKTEIQDELFAFHWKTFLKMIQKVAFEELGLHKIFTYAFDVRPWLYPIIEATGFEREATLKEHSFIGGSWKDVVIHRKIAETIHIRQVNENDSEVIFFWANDESTRKNSFRSEKITFEGHEQWFHQKTSSPDSVLLMVEYNGVKAAFIRFDNENNDIVIGININPEFRGKNLSSKFIIKALQYFGSAKNVLAYIKPSNIPSVKTFEKAGFKYLKETEIYHQRALVYIKENDAK
ncbi:MAG: GNAT family N-acetyltransferase [Saprospiraceae bacterium]|nr:GNAT family N-acetyltransferase [Saprospiraceae bacterium]